MAGEIQAQWAAGRTLYAIVWNSVGLVWNTSTLAFESFAGGSYANYTIQMVAQGTTLGFYTGTFPPQIIPGVYSIVVYNQLGGSPAEGDPPVAEGNEEWSGTVTLPLSNLATSGQLGQAIPIKLARSWAVDNFPIYLKSASDHITPMTSGIVSGQIIRNPSSGSVFGPLQSGEFWEVGQGYYTLRSLTSGDLNANTVALLFTATGISGGTSDPLPITLILQRPTSGGV